MFSPELQLMIEVEFSVRRKYIYFLMCVIWYEVASAHFTTKSFTNTVQATFLPTIPLCNLRLEASTPTEQKTKHSNRKTD